MTPPSASSIRVVPAVGQSVAGVGKYRYIAMLAEGGMADVYLAVTQSAGFEKLVVIKQLRDSLAEDPTFVTMFMDEARLAARLNHPNVVQTLEVGTDRVNGLHFIAMEFLEGVAHVRFARLKDRIPPPIAFSVRILVDVLRGLHYAHELCDFNGTPLNVVHRDVSPQNVMLTFAGGVKILDFGIAKAALAVEQRPEDFKGKLEYMAPEQARMEDVDRRADIFSVGVMLWEALTRRRLYKKGEDKLQLLTEGQLPSVLSVAPSSPKRLAAICANAMAHDRNARYPTADAMADELEDWLGSTTQHVSARDVGSYIADKFESTRTKIRTAIEAQLTLFRSLTEEGPDTLPLSRLPVEAVTTGDYSDMPPNGPNGTLPPPQMMPPSFGNNPAPNFGGMPSGVHIGPSGVPQHALPGAFPPLHPNHSNDPNVTGPHQPLQPTVAPVHMGRGSGSGNHAQQQRPMMSGVMIAVMAIAAVALVAIAVAVASQSKGKKTASMSASGGTASGTSSTQPASLAAGAGASSAQPSSSNAVDEAQIELTIKATPPEAKISLDGKLLPTNPAVGKRTRDGAMHVLHIEAPGYEPREESIGFDRSLFVSFDLHPSAPTVELGGNTSTSGGNTSTVGPPISRNNNSRTQSRPRYVPPPPAPRPHNTSGSKEKPLDSDNPYQP